MASGFPASAVAVAVLAAMAAMNPAYAERRPVAVISLSDEPDATQLAQQLYATLLDHPDLSPLPDPSLNPALQGRFDDENADALQQARSSRAEAESNLGLATPDFKTAASYARTGLDRLSQVAPSVPDLKQVYADLMFDFGYAQLGQGKDADARLAFRLCHRLDPSRQVDRARYLPEIADAFDKAATQTVSKSPLTVKGKGTVWIDGDEIGDAPQTLNVDDGLHLVQLMGPDRETRGEQVLVPQRAETTIADWPATEELKVKRARNELYNAKDSLTRASAVKRLAALLHVADAVIISKSSGGALLIQTWRDNEQGFSAIREHATEKPLDLLTPLAPPRPKEPVKPIEIEPKKLPIVIEKPWYQKTWVRASAATGIVAIVVSAILIARRDEMVDFGGGDIKPGMK
jgi:hypothetical protein